MIDEYTDFFAEDPDRLQILLAGRKIEKNEAKRWYAELYGGRKRLLLVGFALCMLFFTTALSFTSVTMLTLLEFSVASSLVLSGIIILACVLAALLYYPRHQAMKRYKEYAADSERHLFGSMISFYADRIVFRSLRGDAVVRFDEIADCVETTEGFALYDGCVWYILRGSDLTGFDARLVRDFLAEKLPSEVIRRKARVLAMLQQPLPIFPITPRTQVLTRAVVKENTTEAYRADKRCRFWLVMAMVLPLSWIPGISLAALFIITPYYLVDLAIFCGGSMLVGALAAAGVFALFRRKSGSLILSFEPDGLRISSDETQRFIPKARLWLNTADNDVTLYIVDDKKLSIPAEAVEDLSVLRALSGVE